MPSKFAKWILSGLSFAAAVLALLSPWTAVSPFFSPLGIWVSVILPLLFGGTSAVAVGRFSILSIILPLLGSVIFAVPLLGLQRVVSNSRLKPYSTGAAIGVFLVGTGEALELALTRSAAWDPWQIVELALVVLFGFLLIRCGLAMIVQVSPPSFASVKSLGWLIFSIGICFSSFVLIPVGVLGGVGLYFVIGITFLRLSRSNH